MKTREHLLLYYVLDHYCAGIYLLITSGCYIYFALLFYFSPNLYNVLNNDICGGTVVDGKQKFGSFIRFHNVKQQLTTQTKKAAVISYILYRY